MLEAVPELTPLTQDQRQAIHDCRFCTTNVPRDHAWLIFNDPEIVSRLKGVIKRSEKYTRDRVTGKTEYEALVGHPEAIEVVVEIMEKRAVTRYQEVAG